MNSGKPSTSRLSAHVKTVPNLDPDLAFIHRFVLKTETGNHWFIRDGRRPDRRHNHLGHAFLKLRVLPTLTTHFQGVGDYCLARLFLEQTKGPFPPRSSFENTCGLSQCVNPDHWRLIAASPTWRFEQLAQGRWQLIRHKTGRPAQEDIALRARDVAGVVHVFTVAPLSKRPDGPPQSLCGATFFAPDLRPTKDAVTCTKGC